MDRKSTVIVNKGLVWVIVLIFAGLFYTVFWLFNSLEEVRALDTQKKVLIDRYAEELLEKKKLQKENDSLKKELQKQQPIFGPDSLAVD